LNHFRGEKLFQLKLQMNINLLQLVLSPKYRSILDFRRKKNGKKVLWLLLQYADFSNLLFFKNWPSAEGSFSKTYWSAEIRENFLICYMDTFANIFHSIRKC
jgi:hypothetical protein